MAEGGEDIPMEPIDPREGEDDRDDERGGDDWDTEHRSHHFNPSYEPDEETRPLIDPVERRFADKEKAEDFLSSVFVDPRVDQILCGVDDYDRVWVSLTGKRATKYVHQPSGRFLIQANKEMSRTLKQLLGQTNEEAMESNDQIIEQNVETVRQLSESRIATKDLERQNKKLSKTITEKEKVVNKLRDQLEKSTSPSERKRLDEEINKVKMDLAQERAKNQNTMRENNAEIDRLRQQMENGENQEEIERLEAENERLGEQNEEIFSRMSLRDKVKYIFKKYGFTIFGVLAAVGAVIGVIVSNLKAGLTNVAKGVGNGLKELAKKLGQILPGMVGAIVSFLFKAAGEAVGFLAKHAWLLIMLVVTFAVEQLKN